VNILGWKFWGDSPSVAVSVPENSGVGVAVEDEPTTPFDVVDRAKKLLVKHPVAARPELVDEVSELSGLMGDTVERARRELGYDSDRMFQKSARQVSSYVGMSNNLHKVFETLLADAEIEPFSAQSVADYMRVIQDQTATRPAKEFCRRLGIRVGRIDSWGVSGSCSRQDRSFSEEPVLQVNGANFALADMNTGLSDRALSRLAALTLLGRLLMHPSTAALNWYVCRLPDYKDVVPEYVLAKALLLNELLAKGGNSHLRLEFHVVFSAANASRYAQILSWPRNAIATPLRMDLEIQGTRLPIQLEGHPTLLRGHSLDLSVVIKEVERFNEQLRVKQRRLEEAYTSLNLDDRLALDADSIQPLPLAEPFLTATLVDPRNERIFRREVVEVWDERDFRP